jgi:hypothetical protein
VISSPLPIFSSRFSLLRFHGTSTPLARVPSSEFQPTGLFHLAAKSRKKESEGDMRGASDDDVEERGVELGLSLGANKNNNRNAAPARRGPACRILTAKDFPDSIAGRSRASRASPSPTPSRSSSVSSSSVRAVDADSGTDVVVGSTPPETGSGSANPSGSVPYFRSKFVSCCLFFIFSFGYLFATICVCK